MSIVAVALGYTCMPIFNSSVRHSFHFIMWCVLLVIRGTCVISWHVSDMSCGYSVWTILLLGICGRYIHLYIPSDNFLSMCSLEVVYRKLIGLCLEPLYIGHSIIELVAMPSFRAYTHAIGKH